MEQLLEAVPGGGSIEEGDGLVLEGGLCNDYLENSLVELDDGEGLLAAIVVSGFGAESLN